MVNVYEIIWNTSEAEINEQHLPEEINISDSEMFTHFDLDEDWNSTADIPKDELEDLIGCYLNDVYGYCNISFKFK